MRFSLLVKFFVLRFWMIFSLVLQFLIYSIVPLNKRCRRISFFTFFSFVPVQLFFFTASIFTDNSATEKKTSVAAHLISNT